MTGVILCLAGLQMKHFIADFCLQSPRMLAEKGRYFARGGLVHALMHGAGTALVLVFFVPAPIALLAAFGDAVIHYHIDWAKERISGDQEARTVVFWALFGADQMLHQWSMLGIVYVCFLL